MSIATRSKYCRENVGRSVFGLRSVTGRTIDKRIFQSHQVGAPGNETMLMAKRKSEALASRRVLNIINIGFANRLLERPELLYRCLYFSSSNVV